MGGSASEGEEGASGRPGADVAAGLGLLRDSGAGPGWVC